MRRALTLETRADGLHLFIPPLLQGPCRQLLDLTTKLLSRHATPYFFEGYLPLDDANSWTRVGLTADPGVLEVNLPPCETWHDYHRWLSILAETGAACGLRSWKDFQPGDPGGTGGGNHLLFGGPTLDENPFFARPAWVASLLRYFQAHPCLAYFFTGRYVGASSQAPRPDESARDLHDLDLAYRYFEGLPAGDHRYLLGETLRHLHTDISGNTHRSEISFDKFWDVNGPPSAAAGLIEFRAIESMPHAEWMSLVALLWQAIAAYTAEQPRHRPTHRARRQVARRVFPAHPALDGPPPHPRRPARRRVRFSHRRFPGDLAMAFSAAAPDTPAGSAPGLRGLAVAFRNPERGWFDQPFRRYLH